MELLRLPGLCHVCLCVVLIDLSLGALALGACLAQVFQTLCPLVYSFLGAMGLLPLRHSTTWQRGDRSGCQAEGEPSSPTASSSGDDSDAIFERAEDTDNSDNLSQKGIKEFRQIIASEGLDVKGNTRGWHSRIIDDIC